MEIVDAQIHLWQGPGAPAHHRQQPYLVDDALAGMAAAGVDRAINCPAIWDPAANEYAVHVAEQHPDRFATLGWFPLDGPPDPEAVDRLLRRPGMVGLRFMLATPQGTRALDTGSLDWLWAAADAHETAMGLMVLPEDLAAVGDIARRFPRQRILLDHLAARPFHQLPAAEAHLGDLLALAAHPNVAVKATAIPSIATDDFPFVSTHDVLRRTFDSFGPHRMFWGSDITRLTCTWSQCVAMFVDHLPWLRGSDLDLVMGAGVRAWVGWN